MPELTVSGSRAVVLSSVAEHLARMDEISARTDTPRVADYTDPLKRLQHLEALLRCVRAGVQADREKVPSPHYLRAVASQACAWLESEYELGRVSW